MAINQLSQRNFLAEEEDTRPVDYFKIVHKTFQAAAQVSGGVIEHFYTIGSYTICLRFAGYALVPYTTPALAHLATEPDPAPALTICLWDSASTRTTMPPPPWQADAHRAHGEIRGYNSDRIHTVFDLGSNIFSTLDTMLDLAVFWVCDARDIPYYECGAPLGTILHWWMSNHARQFVHAAAVGTSIGGVLLAGKGGSGKSTTALTCLDSGLAYVSDDYCLLATDVVPYVYSLYSSAKLNADNIQRFPHLASVISNAKSLDSEKALLFLHEHYPEQIVTGLPIRAILLPRITGHLETRLTAASSAEGLIALAPSTIFQLPGAGSVAFQAMTKFVKQVPCYILELGTDLSRIPGVILSLLSGS